MQWQYYQTLQLNWNLTGKEEDVYIVNRRIADLVEFRNKAYGFTNYFKNQFSQYCLKSKVVKEIKENKESSGGY